MTFTSIGGLGAASAATGMPRSDAAPAKPSVVRRRRKESTAKRRQARARSEGPPLGNVPPLRAASVQKRTLRIYWSLMVCLEAFWKAGGPRRGAELGNDEIDGVTARWMEAEFLNGEPADMGSRMLAAIKFFRPEFSRSGSASLPKATQALRGWKRRAPTQTKMPLPFEAVVLIAWRLATTGYWTSAVAVVLMFSLYLRPSEPFLLTGSQLTPPIAGSRHKFWVVVLHPEERLVASKTMQFNEAIPCDSPDLQWLNPALKFLRSATAQDAPVFPFTQAAFGRRFTAAAKELGIASLGGTAGHLRHSGPSHDMGCRHRTLAAIKLRGRWASDASVRRYQKEGRVSEQLAKIPEVLRASVPRKLAELQRLFAAPLAAPWPKGVALPASRRQW